VEISRKQMLVESHASMNDAKLRKWRINSGIQAIEEKLPEYKKIFSSKEFVECSKEILKTIIQRLKFYSSDKVLQLQFDTFVRKEATMEKLLQEEFGSNTNQLVIVGSWAAPRVGKGTKDHLKAPQSVGSAKKLLEKLKKKGFRVLYCNEAFSTQQCHRCDEIGLHCLPTPAEKKDKKPPTQPTVNNNRFDPLRNLIEEDHAHDDVVADVVADEKINNCEIDDKEKKLQRKYKNRRRKNNHEKKSSECSSSTTTTNTNNMDSNSNNNDSNSNNNNTTTTNDDNNNKKKKIPKKIRCLQQCNSKTCKGRIVCRDVQSSKRQGKNVLWPSGPIPPYIGKKKRKKKNNDEDDDNGIGKKKKKIEEYTEEEEENLIKHLLNKLENKKRKKNEDDEKKEKKDVDQPEQKSQKTTTSSSSSTNLTINIPSPETTTASAVVVNPDDARKGVEGKKT